MRSHVVLTAATLLHLLCTLQLLTTGSAYYFCGRNEDCNYEGCNDNPCTFTSPLCKNGVWDHLCVSSHKQPIDVFSAAFSNLDICLVPNSFCRFLFHCTIVAPLVQSRLYFAYDISHAQFLVLETSYVSQFPLPLLLTNSYLKSKLHTYTSCCVA